MVFCKLLAVRHFLQSQAEALTQKWDTTDVHSTTVSDGSTIVADYAGRCLRRAVDQKVRSLRTMLSADEDITTELDRVVCRLMKLALRSSKMRQSPPPTRWMQCKLLDLLTLTEKAIGRRKKHFIESFPLKTIAFDTKPQEIEQDSRIKEIVDKYRHLIQPIEKMTNTDGETNGPFDLDMDDDFFSTTSNEFLKDIEYIEGITPSMIIPKPAFSTETFNPEKSSGKDNNSLERTKAWIDDDIEVVSYKNHDVNYENISSGGDTDHSVSNVRYKHKKSSKKHKSNSNKGVQELETEVCEASQSRTSHNKFKIKREVKKKKTSNTLISKKGSKSKSSYNSLVKNPGGKYSSAENYVLSSKRKHNELQCFNVNASKPIPESLIEFCHPELKMEKGVEAFRATSNTDEANAIVISNQPSCNISATEESFLIDIVMQDFEETIALRRTIGTDAEELPKFIKRDQVETLSSDLDEILGTKHHVSTENVQSQTIFLNDINEPSTSKGIRHNISTDVQCGPDTFSAYPTLSASTSLVRMPQVFSTGIKIHDVAAVTKVKGTDFGTSTQDNGNFTTITPRLTSVGIKIKDSDVNICTKIECFTMTVAETQCKTSATVTSTHSTHNSDVNSAVSFPETKLLNPISSTIKTESGSEFCGASGISSSKTLYLHDKKTYFLNVSKNKSDVLTQSSVSKEVVTETTSATKYVRPRLSCGGVHVHSYKDKQVSEDIVYQGEWQRYRPKALARKKTCNITTIRSKTSDAVVRKKKENLKVKIANSKEKIYMKRQDKKQIEAEPKKLTLCRNVKLHRIRQENVTKDHIKKPPSVNNVVRKTSSTMKISTPSKTVPKGTSKIAMSTLPSKNAKSYTVKRAVMLPNLSVKKDNEKPKIKKNYIPLYLKKSAQFTTSVKKNLNKSLDSASAALKANIHNPNKIPTLVRSRTEEIRKDLLKFNDEVRENVSYVVFRNDLEEKIEPPVPQSSENTSDSNRNSNNNLEMLKRAHSRQSLNSSTCSSPNSIATVRAASTRIKTSNKRHSTSSYKSSFTNSESDNPTPTKTKKTVKRCKTAKRSDNKETDNKENIPESTKNFAGKDKDKNKSPFVGRHKSVCIAQTKTESSATPNTLSRHKAQISNKSIKISQPKDDDDRSKRRPSSPSVSKKRSLKSDTSSAYEDLNQSQTESYSSSNSANMVLVLEPQPTNEELSSTQNISLFRSEECAVMNDNKLLAEWLQNTSLHSRASSILNSMRQLLEETLDLIVSPSESNMSLDSKTVILSRDDFLKTNAERETVINPVENLNISFLENDIENALNRTYDSLLRDESMVSLNDTRLTVTDLDLLSFKSITSVSKYSEYFLADNELNTSQSIEQTQSYPYTSSVHDIFERKEPHLVPNAPGALAVQAFSGFSLNTEPLSGDQLDSVALIDSETGSLGLDFSRLATSEELFISGRSSDSYESCLIDDDTVVPNWLFQIISQQQSVEEGPEPLLLGPAAAPLDEPLYDANGNVIEPALIGVGAGAGDGRGMHSDHSQDSSGRGTSLSSSDTSSGPQSDVSAIVIDSSAFTAQFELLRNPMASSLLVPVHANTSESPDRTYIIHDGPGTLIGVYNNRTRTLTGASDVDADISSIDTDLPDSSDN